MVDSYDVDICNGNLIVIGKVTVRYHLLIQCDEEMINEYFVFGLSSGTFLEKSSRLQDFINGYEKRIHSQNEFSLIFMIFWGTSYLYYYMFYYIFLRR